MFAPNGRDVIVEQTDDGGPQAPASLVYRFDGRTGARRGPPLRVGEHAAFGLFATGDRRRLFASSPGDGRTYAIDPERLRIVAQWPHGAFAANVSRDGRLLALGSDDGTVQLLDLRSGRLRTLPERRGEVLRMAFTPDGGTLVTSSSDGELTLWDVAEGRVRERLPAHGAAVWGLQVAADGRTLYSASIDARALVWDLTGDRRLDRPFDPGPEFSTFDGDRTPRGLAVSPDGRRLAVTQADGTVELLDTRALTPARRFRALRGWAAAVAFSPDGRLIAATGKDGRVTLWDARTLRATGELRGLPRRHAQAIAFSGDGRLLSAATLGDIERGEGQVRVWDVRRRTPTGRPFRVSSASLAFSPDRRLLAAAGAEFPTEVREARSGRVVARLATPDYGRTVAFSPDGTVLATGHYDGTVQLWSVGDWHRVGPLLHAHRGRVTALQFAPDGRTLLTGGADGTVLLWDVATRRQLGSALTVDANGYIAAAFAPDGAHVFAASDGSRGVRWEVAPQAWERRACAVAGRDLTRAEWRDALPGRPYRAVCRGG